MTRPQMIRADTIDLQDHLAPSAKDHTKQPTHPAAFGAGPPAPHQAETLRDVAAEAEEEQHRSPRVSTDWNGSDEDDHATTFGSSSLTGANLQQQDALAIAQNGGLTGAEDADMADAEGDDGLDDDILDKISSSPSIDDGGYPIPQLWPERFDSLSTVVTPRNSLLFSHDSSGDSSSPYVETPDEYPLYFLDVKVEKGILGPDYYQCFFDDESLAAEIDLVEDASSNYDEERRDVLGPLPRDLMSPVVQNYDDDFEACFADELFVVQADFYHRDDSFHGGFGSRGVTVPYESSEEEDSEDDVPFPEDSRFIDSGWGGECLQGSEDIDFDLVYALHTFVATVEGQANATKGDTMVLLDDSNSYWWLVRVVKDSSIGYLPAEHIETPTERLARLNKHRNIDLSATMLGDKDQAEKSKNPLKIAIRRRNAKTVTFTAPTYVEASDVDYSTDEDELDGEFYGRERQQGPSQQAEKEDDEITLVEAPKQNGDGKNEETDAGEIESRTVDDKTPQTSSEITRTSEETFDSKTESIGKSRNGTVRNTDSFFRDDTVETRKITLTPNLLRDDSISTSRTSNDSKESRQRPSLDKVDKDAGSERGRDDKRKKDKKEKDRKPGMLSNLFKRKDKKGKMQEEDIDDLIYGKKGSSEDARTSPVPSKESEDFPSEEHVAQVQGPPQRQPSKLQKPPRMEPSNSKPANSANSAADNRSAEPQQIAKADRVQPAASAIDPSMRPVQPDTQQHHESNARNRDVSPEVTRGLSAAQDDKDDSKSTGTFSKILRARSGSNSEPRPEKLKQAKVRAELDDFDSSADASPVEDQAKEPSAQTLQRPKIPGSFPDSYTTTPGDERQDAMNERLSESPVQVSPVDGSRSNPPALMVDSSSQEEAPSPASSPSPELVDVDEIHGKKGSEHSISTPTSTSTWSDAHLRTFFDDDTDIKDLLLVVYDKSGVIPAGPDHPITGNLFKEENAKLADITTRLDGMLSDWLARKVKDTAPR